MKEKTLENYLGERHVKKDALNEILERLGRIEEKLEEISQKLEEMATTTARPSGTAGERRRRRTAYDYLVEEGFVSMSSLKGRVRDPRRIIDRLAEKGAIIIEAEGDVIAVEPRYYREFLEKLRSLDTMDEEVIASKLGRYYKLFKALREVGLIYFDHRTKKWETV